MASVVQIVKVEKGKVVLDSKSLKKILKDANVGDKPVAIVSLCGDYGKGKSFMSKLFLQYLGYSKGHRVSEEATDWLDDKIGEDSIQTDEPGIFLYRNVHIVNNTAVLMMQVQGAFSATRQICVDIFALASLISSVQILNLHSQMLGNDVEFVKEFVERARPIAPDLQMFENWGPNFLFLVRDWQHPMEKSFGRKGGNEYLNSVLKNIKFNKDEWKDFKWYMEQLFKTVNCFLMPHPGMGTQGKRNVETDDLSAQFRDNLQSLVSSALGPKFLQAIVVRQDTLSEEKFFSHVEKCVKELSKPKKAPKTDVVKIITGNLRKDIQPKPQSVSKHCAVKVIDIEDGKVILNSEEFEKVLNQPEIGNRPIAVISIAGTFRRGKSFILNFLLRYVRNKGYLRKDDEWIGNKSDRIADGFEWCSGSAAHTQGIMIFSEPFIVATPKGEVAVLFMDTQGLFDSNTSKTQNLMIFAFNTIISSVQILNLSGDINEHDLEFLQFFTEYARRITQQKSGGAFLQGLKFLIRDWPHVNDHEFGSNGGKDYLEKYMETKGKIEELKVVRKYISSAYRNISCFLMPHPGLTLAQGLPYDKATVNDIDEKFVQQLTPLAESVLHPDNLIVKEFSDGKPMNYRGLYATATKCADAFGTIDTDIKVDDILEVIASAEDNEMRRACLNHYTELMSKYIVGCASDTEAKLKHNKAKSEAIGKFYSRGKGGKNEKRVQSRTHAEGEIDKAYARFLAKLGYNEAKEKHDMVSGYLDAISSYKNKMSILEDKPVPPTEFDTFNETCWKEAMGSTEKYGNGYSDLSSEDMKKEKTRFYENYKEQNRNRYEATIERLEMPGNYMEMCRHHSTNEVEDESEDQDLYATINKVVDQYEKKINEIREGGEVSEDFVREKRGSLYRSAVREFNSSSINRKGNFRYYINMLEKAVQKVEPVRIAPSKERLLNMKLKNYVADSSRQFDQEMEQINGLFIGPVALNAMVQKAKLKLCEKFNDRTKDDEPRNVVERHHNDLIRNLDSKWELLKKENERNRVHYELAKNQLEMKLVKRYHSSMDQLLQSGYIVEKKLKKYHEDLRQILLQDAENEEIPLYVANGGNRNSYVSYQQFIGSLQAKLNGLYEEKKTWNKKNHGMIVRALVNFVG
ncbi:uncharacterized protein LOC120332744 [Styela clava]